MTANSDLRDLVLTAVQNTPGIDISYDDVARRVIAGFTAAEAASALATVMPTYVRKVCSEARSVLGGVGDAGDTTEPVEPVEHKFTPAPGQSWKVKGIREGWRKHLGSVYSGERGPMRLCHFGVPDIKHLVGELNHQSTQMAGKAALFDRLRSAVEHAGVATVGDLPDDVLAAILSGLR